MPRSPHAHATQLHPYQFGALDTAYVIHELYMRSTNPVLLIIRRFKKLDQTEIFIHYRHNLGLNTILESSFLILDIPH